MKTLDKPSTMTENKFQHYLPEEDEAIVKMVNEGKQPWEIAEALGRTEITLYYRRRKLGLAAGPWPKSRKYQRIKQLKNKT